MAEQDLFGDVPTPAAPPQRPAKSPAHTWFFALRPSAEEARRIHAFADEWLAAHEVTGKRLNPERLHITLAVVGHDVDEPVVAAAMRAADQVKHAPLQLSFDAVLTFSAPSGPCVMVGQAGLDEVRHLRTMLALALAGAGFAAERSYEPHMTLCYDTQHRLPRTALTPRGFSVAEFVLLKSHIGYSRHELVRAWPLSA